VFTGLVEDLGTVVAVDATVGGVRLTVRTALAAQITPGDSVAVDGVCLTAIGVEETDDVFAADVVCETLRRSSLASIAAGATVNLELALLVTARLGGHIMQGHVDATGTVDAVHEDGFSRVIAVTAGPEVLRYVVEKGSIAVDGISLTVARVDGDGFDVALIPETLQRTTLGAAAPGTLVNLEVDVMAKYAEKLLGARLS